MYKVGLEKAEESEIKSSTLLVMENAREFQKNICFIDYDKIFDCMDHNKLRKITKEMGIQTTLPVSWETYMQIKKQ